MNIILFNYDVNFAGHIEKTDGQQPGAGLDNDGGFNDGWYFSQKWHWENGRGVIIF